MRSIRLLFLVCLGALVAAGVAAGHVALMAGSHSPRTYVADRGQPTIVCLGDSLTAGDGASADESYPAWLQRRLDEAHLGYRVVNAGVSGDRVADGLRRLPTDVLPFHPVVVIVELGSNDPGHTPAPAWERGLDAIVVRLNAHGARVVLAGLDEPGMGEIYRRVAARNGVPLVWFIAAVAGVPGDWHDLHHLNGAGYRLVMESLWPAVQSAV